MARLTEIAQNCKTLAERLQDIALQAFFDDSVKPREPSPDVMSGGFAKPHFFDAHAVALIRAHTPPDQQTPLGRFLAKPNPEVIKILARNESPFINTHYAHDVRARQKLVAEGKYGTLSQKEQNLIRHGSFLTDKEGKTIIAQLALAIKYLHDHNIIHGDIKPKNIIIKLIADEQVALVQLIDFDSAQVKQIGKTFTPKYAAPEQQKFIPLAGELYARTYMTTESKEIAEKEYNEQINRDIPNPKASDIYALGEAIRFVNRLLPLKEENKKLKISLYFLGEQLCKANSMDRPIIDDIIRLPIFREAIEEQQQKFSATKQYINLPQEIELISVAVEGLANKLTYIDKLQPDDPDQPKLVAIIKHKLSILQKDVRAQLRSPEFGEVMRELDAQLTNGLEEIKPLESLESLKQLKRLEHPDDDIRHAQPPCQLL
ncbi:MAG: lipopolysaccharide kinase InaA family protein [Pseudomonadota bacterium]